MRGDSSSDWRDLSAETLLIVLFPPVTGCFGSLIGFWMGEFFHPLDVLGRWGGFGREDSSSDWRDLPAGIAFCMDCGD